MLRYQFFFLVLCSGFLLGIWIFFILVDAILLFFSCIFLFLICLSFYRVKKSSQLFFICFFVFYIIWWIYGFYFSQHHHERLDNVKSFQNLYMEYNWVVIRIQKRSEYYDEYLMRITSLWVDSDVGSQRILHILRVPKNFSLSVGEEYKYFWVLRLPEDFNNFAYSKFLESRSIYFRTSTNNLEKLAESHEDLFYLLFRLREHLISRSEALFPYKESLFLSGILFWAREHLPPEIRTQFNNSWLTHFITTSGFHVSLVILFLSTIVSIFPSYIRVVIIALWVTSFALFVWYWAPVVRASIMGILWYILLQSGASVRNLALIVFTLTLMVILSPMALLYDASLQLSFLAVLGILFTQDFFKKIFSFIPNFLSLRDACILTFASFAGLFPILFFQFWQVSLLTPLANMLVAWTIPPAMLWGAVVLFVDSLFPTLAAYLSFPVWVLLRFDMFIVESIGTMEWAIVVSPFWAHNSELQILYLVILVYIIAYFSLKKQRSL